MFCHEGPWHKVDRIWTIRTDGTGLTKQHTRQMDMEIAGHEFFSADGKTIWYDLQTPKSEVFWLAGVNLATGERTRYAVASARTGRCTSTSRRTASCSRATAAGRAASPRPATASGSTCSRRRRRASWPRRSSISQRHDYTLEPNVTFTPDGKWFVFRSNMHGAPHVYAVELAKPPRT